MLRHREKLTVLIYEPRGFINPVANIGKMEISRVELLLNKQLVMSELLNDKIVTAINVVSLTMIILYSLIYSSMHVVQCRVLPIKNKFRISLFTSLQPIRSGCFLFLSSLKRDSQKRHSDEDCAVFFWMMSERASASRCVRPEKKSGRCLFIGSVFYFFTNRPQAKVLCPNLMSQNPREEN